MLAQVRQEVMFVTRVLAEDDDDIGLEYVLLVTDGGRFPLVETEPGGPVSETKQETPEDLEPEQEIPADLETGQEDEPESMPDQETLADLDPEQEIPADS